MVLDSFGLLPSDCVVLKGREMITPKLALNFTAAVLDPRITLTRAADTATRINSSGYIENVLANTPRFDHNNLTLVCNGLLIEEQRTNLLRWGRDLGQAVWSISGTGASRTQNSGTNMYGGGTVWTITSSATAGAVFQQVISGTASVDYTVSFWAKRRSGTTTIIRARVGDNTNYDVAGLTTEWKRFSFTAQGSTTTIRVGIEVPAGSNAVDVDCFQLELASFATSYIDTDATVGGIARNADIATITGTNFSSFWQSTRGGVLVRARPGTVSGVRPWVQFDDGTANESIALRGNTTNPELYIVDGGTPQAQIDAGTIAANTDYSLTGWWATNDCKVRLDSGAVVADMTATIPTVTQARLGSDGTNYLNGHLASISYYDSFFGRRIYTRRKNKVISNLM